jgi:putative endonuclease
MTATHKRPSRNRQIGAFGEVTIAKYLEALGYDIIDRNWRIKEGEIDLIALLVNGPQRSSHRSVMQSN